MDGHTPKRPRRHNFWSLTTSLSLAEADGDRALPQLAIYMTIAGVVGIIIAACFRPVFVRWMLPDTADPAPLQEVVLVTIGGIVGVAACCRPVFVQWMLPDTADPAPLEEVVVVSDSGSVATFMSAGEDSWGNHLLLLLFLLLHLETTSSMDRLHKHLFPDSRNVWVSILSINQYLRINTYVSQPSTYCVVTLIELFFRSEECGQLTSYQNEID